MHPTYLPFTEEQVLAHVAAVTGGGPADPRAYLAHFEKALEAHRRATAVASLPRQRDVAAPPAAIAHDERFWTATALLSVLHGPSPVEDLAAVLTRAYGEVPPFAGFASWAEALGTDPELWLEVGMPSPSSYQHHLRGELPRHVLSWAEVRAGRAKVKLEGATRVDAVVVSPSTGVAVVVEAKVRSDLSTSTTYDVRRNQLARLVDVTLDAHPALAQDSLRHRRPDRTCVLLLTPEVFRDDPASRLYGHLHASYTQRPETLAAHLPHRSEPLVHEAARRLGWATWEDVERVRPGALPWRVPGAR
ncbi:hypothetical protein EDC03_2326 [Pseudokineococcus lusitanus]|uniref:Uncharacterized protein n=2 Tax=Pseudokineococcus lusitanus TaxID=763993 RepID=A0A3N1GWE3_9ACTN|nr:hypothetical protein EDC03_2326 [Pseudokineococcus lusitanus]